LIDAPRDEVERLHQAAAEIQISVFGDPHRAVPHQLHLVDLASEGSPQHVERLRSLGASLRASGAIDAWSRCALAELALLGGRPAERHRVAELRFELAEVDRLHLARPDSAIAHLRELSALMASVAPESAGPLSREQRDRAEHTLFDLLRGCGNTVELAERLEARLKRDDIDGDDARSGWRELAQLRGERLHSPLGAAKAWESLLEHDARDLEAIRGLRTSGELLRDWNRVSRGLELELEAIGGRGRDAEQAVVANDTAAGPNDAAGQAALWRRLGEVRWRRLGDLDGATAAFDSALDVCTTDLDALRSLERLCEERRSWNDALDHYEREVELLGDEDPARRREVWLRAGVVARDEVGDDARALRAYESAAAIAELDAPDLRDLAELHHALGDKSSFAEIFSDWCRHSDAEPACSDVMRLSGVLADLGRVSDALEWARTATALDPANATAWDQVAELCGRDADDTAAGEALERAADLLPPREASKRLLEAALLVEDTDADRALDRLRKAVDVEPGDVMAHASLARIADRRGLDEEAEGAAGLALDAGGQGEDDAIDAELMLSTALIGGRCALRRQRNEAAARFYGIALSLSPEEAEALDAQSRISFDAGDLEQARPLLETRLSQPGENPLRAEQAALLARCLEEAGETEAALEKYAAALDLAPANAFAHEGVARIHEAREDSTAALGALERWLERDDVAPSRARTHLRAADHLVSLGRSSDAEVHLRKACADDATLGPAWARLVALLHDAGQNDEALAVSAEAMPRLDGQPEVASVAAIRGELLEANGEREAAAEAYAAAAQADPKAADAVLAQARLLRNGGDWFAANQALLTFVERHPDADDRTLAPIHLERGRLLAGPMEDVDEALVAYERALVLDPDLDLAREPLAGLLARIPSRWSEAVEHHAVLLRRDPLCNASLRALLEIARRRDLDLSVQFGLALLRAVGMASPSEMSEAPELLPVKLSATPKLDDPLFETARRICSQARDEIAQVLASLDQIPPPGDGDGSFEETLRGAIDEITAPGVCGLPTEGLSSVVYTVTALAADPGGNCADSPYLHGLDRTLGRWTRRRIRKTLGDHSVREVQSLDYDAWRSAVRVLGARIAIDRSDGDLRAALIHLATGEDAAPASNADLSAWIEASSDAQELVGRMVATWCEKIRRGL
jgi:tetratricopeptide (TPR) repeat protein